MTTKTVLTDEEIQRIGLEMPAMPLKGSLIEFARAIEQAVLQSEQAQAPRKGAERIQFVVDKHCMFDTRIQADGTTKYRLGWNAGTKWRDNWFDSPSAAIDAAMEQQT